MPTYEYKCEKCGYLFEEFQSINAEPLKNCKKEDCDGEVKRLFSAGAGFIFKGSGFYITDYRSDSYKKAANGDSSSNSSSPSEISSPSTSTPASTPASTSTSSTTSSSTSPTSSSSTTK